VTISIGAGALEPGMSVADLYRSADEMLYEAKRTGRNRVCH
jgi:PleD family two-component response regulator